MILKNLVILFVYTVVAIVQDNILGKQKNRRKVVKDLVV